jgi:thymidylate kinase
MINPKRGLRPVLTPDINLSQPEEIIAPGATKGSVLRELFKGIHQEGLIYAVLRNYEGLPEKPGRDVDILTYDFEKFKQMITQVSEKAGYSVRIFRHYDSLVKFHLISEITEGCDVLEIDVGWDFRWKGIPLIPQDLLEYHRIQKKEFFTLRPGTEAAISLIKDLIYHGAVKEKYKPVITEMIRTDRDGFLSVLAPAFGLPLVTELANLSSQGEWGQIKGLVSQLRRQAVIRALRHQPVAQLGRWAAFLWWNLLKFFRPSGLFVVLIGPDGSGKSTVSAGLQTCLSSLFQGSKYFHAHFKNLPRLRDLARLLGFKVAPEAPTSQTVPEKSSRDERRLSRLHSLALLLYYTLDYLLGYPLIIRSRGNGELIVFDRYFYDYLVQPGMNLPHWLLTLVMWIIPNPDAVIYLKNSPEVILSRKPELTRQELERQGVVCGRLISQLDHGYLVETTGTPEETIAKVAKILVAKICRTVEPAL